MNEKESGKTSKPSKRPLDTESVYHLKFTKIDDSCCESYSEKEKYAFNSRNFTIEEIINFKRITAYECIVPKTRKCDSYRVIRSQVEKEIDNPCNDNFIPTHSMLLNWQCELQKSPTYLTDCEFKYIEFTYGNTEKRYDLAGCQIAQKLHIARDIKHSVEKEIRFFSSSCNIPRCIEKSLDSRLLKNFQKKIWETPRHNKVIGLDMMPDELARLCGKRYLSDEHMLWISEKLNLLQNNVFVIYGNFVRDIESFCNRLKTRKCDIPPVLFFIFNVGCGSDGTFLGSCSRPGCHFSICIYEHNMSKIMYGDSLGWATPKDLKNLISRYAKALYNIETVNEIGEFHCSENTYNGVHSCLDNCKNYFPLQKDGHICGVAAIFMAAIACLAPLFWQFIMKTDHKDKEKFPFIYFKEPSKYYKYMRKVLVSWFSEGNIDIENILPSDWLSGSSVPDVSDSDESVDISRIDNANSNSEQEDTKKRVEIEVTKSNDAFVCSLCSEKFTRKSSLKRHLLRKHSAEKTFIEQSGNTVCLECSRRFHKTSQMKKHLMEDHGFVFPTNINKHNSFSAFEDWKNDIERHHSCSFKKLKGNMKNQFAEQVVYLQCNRSGRFKSKRTGKRRFKSSGTRLIENNCTCTIKVTYHSDGTCTSESCLIHYGHEVELQHLNITNDFRSQIAAKLKQGVSREKILDDIRNKVGGTIQREHLIEEQDLRNIALAYGIDQSRRHDNDQQSVLSWIYEWAEEDETPILYYKMQGSPDDNFPELNNDDFIIIIQTQSQKHMMQKFVEKGVCCDTTHGTTGYDFKLTSLLIVDEFHEGIPVAHCLSNKENFEFMRIFFETVSNNSGKASPKWFMSDTAVQFYGAFCVANNCEPIHLFCTWHVDKAWREEIRRKIVSVELQSEVYKHLRTVLEQTDKIVFEDYLEELQRRLTNSEATLPFADYFRKEWLPKKEKWGYAYRISLGINTNMFCEAFHRVFKYKYLKGILNKRVDNCLLNLLKFNRDKIFSRLCKLTKGKHSAKSNRIYKSHISSQELSFSKVEESKANNVKNKWVVNSEDGKRFYDISQVSPDPCGCRMICEECDVCVHQYLCQCPDFLIYNNICKHIHLLCRFRRSHTDLKHEGDNFGVEPKEGCEFQHDGDALLGDPAEDNNDTLQETEKEELSVLGTFIKAEEFDSSFESLKANVEKSVLSLLAELQSCTVFDKEALGETMRAINAAKNTLITMKKYRNIETLEAKVKGTNNRVQKQQRFYSTKKKSKERKIRMAKPSCEEKEKIFADERWSFITSEDLNTKKENPNFTEVCKKLASLGVKRDFLKSWNYCSCISRNDLDCDFELDGEVLNFNLHNLEKYFSKETWRLINTQVDCLKELWSCCICNQSKYTNMVECENCKRWFHWTCVEYSESDDWECQDCQKIFLKSTSCA